MKDMLRVRTWAGPVTIGAFFAMALTGILMFFHVNMGLIHPVHEWLGWLMIIGGLAHLTANWRPFKVYLRKPAALAIIASILAMGVIAVVPIGGSTHGGPPFKVAIGALERSPLGIVAQVVKCTPESAVQSLRARGFVVHDEQHTILEIASDSDRTSGDVLACVVDQEAQHE